MLYNTICYDDVWGRSVYVVVTIVLPATTVERVVNLIFH